MKNIKNIVLLTLLTLSFSCSDNYLDVNGSSTSPSSSTPDLVLPAAQKNSADMLYDADKLNASGDSFNRIGSIHAGVLADAGDRVWYQPEQQYLILNSTYSRIWENTYTLALFTYNFIETFEADGYDNYKAIAKIMKAFHIAMLVDTYGDIPYSEAFGRGNNTQPAYDDDKAVYDAIYEELNTAISMIDNAPAGTLAASTDAMLGGDMEEWKKFANTLKLRMLLRQVNTAVDLSSQYSELTSNGIGFVDTTVSVNPGYANQANQQNPFYTIFGLTPGGTPTNNNQAARGNEFFVEFLRDNNDPRLTQLFVPAASDGEIRGIPQNVYTNALRADATSALGPGLLVSSTQDLQVMLGSESLFLQAEAAFRGLISGDPAALYRAGIAASFSELGATGADVYESAAFSNKINWDLAAAAGNEIEAIITQKWIAGGFISGFEVWMDRVRTGFPSGIPIPTGAFSPVFPSNLLYPTSELATNSANVPEQGDNAAFDRHTFWMQ
ncbi:SusD/RagB family nutrient-binding outer membrane lipoprotein [Flavivirga rizhaonensis]|uniref:SusD/RagB family nutrient-binding outer membrane lipoprotein n=1 Tax=Flavivirga rizhaonensis TaxID=2559571 RepID=A0A4S1DVD9_9FLAO|nr:SusD/RagB family nutrient-binding outer membrane lipoprotein [Flavivirga rizhaonensis]TGV02047.1 SusD/RagB family nutrient-binding outer membrane lipoprotein [Flavivirga rizhaonensis]